jgi:phosphoadenosine phosphosulfate reductase
MDRRRVIHRHCQFARPQADITGSTISDDQVAALNRLFEGAAPQRILRWAVAEFRPRLTMATAFGAEGCCLIHMLAEIEPGVRTFNLDTGYQFPETLELRERIKKRYGIAVELVQPELTVPEYETEHGGPLYRRRPDQCCHDRKVVPLRRALAGYHAWVSASRRDQTADRALAEAVQWDARLGLVKVNPLLWWRRRDVWKFILAHDVPYNPLHDRGYPSIGCWPCTRAVSAGEHERAGRWADTSKKECGMNVIEQPEDPLPHHVSSGVRRHGLLANDVQVGNMRAPGMGDEADGSVSHQ